MRRKLLALSFFFGCLLLITGCSTNAQNIVSEQYPLQDVVKSSTDANDVARVYVAEGKSIDEVAKNLQSKKAPQEISQKQGSKQVLVYDDYFVTLTQDESNPNNTLVEVASYGFVRDNYQPDFFDGLLAYWFLDKIFGVPDWRDQQRKRCFDARGGDCYGGYNRSGGRYKGPQTPPTFRGSPVRGGGPGTGK
jgi:hypothetical protein